ncbi:MAG: Hpt domain-containing protein [Nitrospira sp.]|nr:Hpt domain-containing protein [Nitrospira sp.]
MSDEIREILNDFLTESNEMLEVLDQRFVTLESDPTNTDLLNEIFRAMHSMKGSAGFLGFNHLVDVAHRGENILNKLRQAEMAVSPAIISVILETVDVIKAIMADIKDSGTDSHVPTGAISAKLDDILNGDPTAAAARSRHHPKPRRPLRRHPDAAPGPSTRPSARSWSTTDWHRKNKSSMR